MVNEGFFQKKLNNVPGVLLWKVWMFSILQYTYFHIKFGVHCLSIIKEITKLPQWLYKISHFTEFCQKFVRRILPRIKTGSS